MRDGYVQSCALGSGNSSTTRKGCGSENGIEMSGQLDLILQPRKRWVSGAGME